MKIRLREIVADFTREVEVEVDPADLTGRPGIALALDLALRSFFGEIAGPGDRPTPGRDA